MKAKTIYKKIRKHLKEEHVPLWGNFKKAWTYDVEIIFPWTRTVYGISDSEERNWIGISEHSYDSCGRSMFKHYDIESNDNLEDLIEKIISDYKKSKYYQKIIEGYYYNNEFFEEEAHITKIIGEKGKIYVGKTTGKTYRYKD